MLFLARLISRSPWLVLLVWFGVTLASVPFAALAPRALTAEVTSYLHNSEAQEVREILKDEFGETDSNILILVTRSQPSLSTVKGKETYARFIDDLKRIEGVKNIIQPDGASPFPMRSDDAKTAMTLVSIPLEAQGSATLKQIRQLIAQNGVYHSEAFAVEVTGSQAIADDFAHFAEVDTKHSELMALPLIALMLLLVFGALVATGLPLIVGLMSITVSMAVLYGLTFIISINTFTQSMITMLGLGAGIDYALLMVNRFREELTRHPARKAAEETVKTAGRSVIFSGVTVAVALSGLLIPPVDFLRSIGIGGVLVVLLTIVVSVTALPALLALLGEKVNSPKVLSMAWARSGSASSYWTRFAQKVVSRPVLAVIASMALLLVLSVPATQIKAGYAGPWGLTKGVESRDALNAVKEFGAGGLLSQYEVILRLNRPYQASDREEFRRVVDQLKEVPGIRGVVSPFLTSADLGRSVSLSELAAMQKRTWSTNKEFLRVTLIPQDALRADVAKDYEHNIRHVLDQSAFDYYLGGAPIAEKEWALQIMDSLPIVIGFVVIGTFLLLMIAFRSILIPIKSIVLNLMTVIAAVGVVTQVVQFGTLSTLFGIPSDIGILDATLPVILFTVMFGLSMDYEIFVLSRIQEEYLNGKTNTQAVVSAIGRTARIITSAAVIMFIVFSAFIFGRVITTKSIGMGLAVAVLLDVTIIRLILVPAFMTWAGHWNWWLPVWLEKRLPVFKIEH